jgi:uncharacterized protein
MPIDNITKHTRLAASFIETSDPSRQACGLMFTRRKEEFCLIFSFPTPRKEGIHMWFVFYPIDILILDAERKVIAMKERLLPFAFYFPKPRISTVIELPAGTVARTHTVLGDTLTWKTI